MFGFVILRFKDWEKAGNAVNGQKKVVVQLDEAEYICSCSSTANISMSINVLYMLYAYYRQYIIILSPLLPHKKTSDNSYYGTLLWTSDNITIFVLWNAVYIRNFLLNWMLHITISHFYSSANQKMNIFSNIVI